jgi:hypothetical protein
MIIYNWRATRRRSSRPRSDPAAIIMLMAITFLRNGVGAVPPESLRQR